MAELWKRPTYVVGGGKAHVALIALSSKKLPDPLPVSRKRHGMPTEGDGPGAVVLTARDRGEDAAWFSEQVVKPFVDMIAQDLGPAAAATAFAAQHACVIEAELDDPDDLGHLQAAWAIAKCVCEEGAGIVVDVFAARAHLGSEVAELEAEREFDVMWEVTLFFDEQDDGTVTAWTLGMGKLGRPDLVMTGLGEEDTTAAALALRDVAQVLADGEVLEPGDEVGGYVAEEVEFGAIEGPAVRLVKKS